MDNKREWYADVVESIPSIVFLTLWRSGWDLEQAGWVGSASALMTLAVFRYLRWPYTPILLGINIHILVITPLIVSLFKLGAEQLGSNLISLSYNGVLITVFLVGLALTIFSKQGFIGVSGLPPIERRINSIMLLSASAVTILWAFFLTKSTSAFVSVAIPLIALFIIRRLMIAQLKKRHSSI